MQRNNTCSPCPGCGLQISNRRELPFITRKAWRDSVADAFGYDREFIRNLGEKTRIHRHHFREIDIRDNKPIGVPSQNITRVENWPLQRPQQIPKQNKYDLELLDVDDEDPENVENEKYVIVQISQLKQLLRQCHYCGHKIPDETMKTSCRGGVFFANFRCYQCQKKRFWRSTETPLTQFVTGATFASGVGIAKILHFFTILQCAFPSRSSVYYSAQHLVRPVIDQFYNLQRTFFLDRIRNANKGLHIWLDGQFDSPGFSAYYCVVTAIDSVQKFIIDFSMASQHEVNNRSPNAEGIAFRRVLQNLLDEGLEILSVTTNNSVTLNAIMSREFPAIAHYLNLRHILQNMAKKFKPQFNKHHPLLKESFARVSRFLWTCGKNRTLEEDDNKFLQKVVSSIFHLLGLHQWEEGRFVDIYNNHFYHRNFNNGEIQQLKMSEFLACEHQLPINENVLDPNSSEINLLILDICSDLRMKQLRRAVKVIQMSRLESFHSLALMYRSKRYHYWYLDTQSKIAVIHHNSNFLAEEKGDRVIERVTELVGRANNAPSYRVCKTIIYDWQKRLMAFIEERMQHRHAINRNLQIEEEVDDLVEELDDFHVEELFNSEEFDDFEELEEMFLD